MKVMVQINGNNVNPIQMSYNYN